MDQKKYNFTVTLTEKPKVKPDLEKIKFGEVFTDHMFLMDYKKSEDWYNPRIVPYGPLQLDPAAAVLHYAQEMFEGLKAFKGSRDGEVLLFRPDQNAKRAADSCARLCIPIVTEDLFVQAVKALVSVDRDWVPEKDGSSLYIRPYIFATEPFVGVRSAEEFTFAVIMSPVGPYYKEGFSPTKIFVEDENVRAVLGGTGCVKAGGNYAAGLQAQKKAADLGYSQVMWLDGRERRYVDEIGTSNAFFVIDNYIITPPLTGSILPGITRDSAITLLKSWDMDVREENIRIDDMYEAWKRGRLKEVFATGTAAVVSPVGELRYKDVDMVINGGNTGPVAQKLYDTLTGIQRGAVMDQFGWTVLV